MGNSVQLECYVAGLSQTYADGRERVEMYVIGEVPAAVPQPDQGKRMDIILRTPSGDFYSGLRRYPQTGQVYVCPDVVAVATQERTSLARVLEDCGFGAGDTILVRVEAQLWQLSIAHGRRAGGRSAIWGPDFDRRSEPGATHGSKTRSAGNYKARGIRSVVPILISEFSYGRFEV